MTQENAYQAYDYVRGEFPDFANFEGCPWVETDPGISWARSNEGYLLEVTSTRVSVTGRNWSRSWVNKVSGY